MKKAAFITICIVCLSFSYSVKICSAQYYTEIKQISHLQYSNLFELKKIGMMIGKAEPQDEYLAVWKQVVSKSKDIDVNEAIKIIITEAKQQMNRNAQQMSQSASTISDIEKILRDSAMSISSNFK